MAKALRLVRESGTTNMPVTVWSLDDVAGKALGSYLVGLLNDLGYRASLHAVSDDKFFDRPLQPSPQDPGQSRSGWGADFPAPSDFFGPC